MEALVRVGPPDGSVDWGRSFDTIPARSVLSIQVGLHTRSHFEPVEVVLRELQGRADLRQCVRDRVFRRGAEGGVAETQHEGSKL